MDKTRPFALFAALGGILVLAALACNIPGVDFAGGEDPLADIPEAQEHISDEQLQADIDADRAEFFDDDTFRGEMTYDSMESADPANEAACDSGFPQGKDVIVSQRFIPKEESCGPEDKVILWLGGETRIYESTKDEPYVFCRKSHTGKVKNILESKEVVYWECISFRNGGFNLFVKYYDPFEDDYRHCFYDEYRLTDTAAQHFQAFNDQWFSPGKCEGDDEFPYKWTVALSTTKKGVISGTIRFHRCDSGNVVYSVRGQVSVGDDEVALFGTKRSGAGDLFNSAQDEVLFHYTIGGYPIPNLSR